MKRVGKSVISVCKKAQRCYKLHFMAVRKSRKRSGFVIYSFLKDSAFTAIKKDEARYAKGVVRTICLLKVYEMVPFLSRKWYTN